MLGASDVSNSNLSEIEPLRPVAEPRNGHRRLGVAGVDQKRMVGNCSLSNDTLVDQHLQLVMTRPLCVEPIAVPQHFTNRLDAGSQAPANDRNHNPIPVSEPQELILAINSCQSRPTFSD